MSSKFYTTLAFVSPLAAIGLVELYFTISNSTFWASDPDNTAGAMMAFGEVIALLFSLLTGCFFGFVFAGKSIQISKSSIGIVALIINGMVLLLLSIFLVKGFVLGF